MGNEVSSLIAAKRHKEMLDALEAVNNALKNVRSKQDQEVKAILQSVKSSIESVSSSFLSKIEFVSKPYINVHSSSEEIVNSLRGLLGEVLYSNKEVCVSIDKLYEKLSSPKKFEMNVEIDSWTGRIKKITGSIKQ